MLSFLRECEFPHIIVCTKTDKLNKTELTKFTEEIKKHPLTDMAEDIILFSSQTKVGKEELWNKIGGICNL